MDRTLGRLLESEHFAQPAPKMAFLVGPRQSGKTTLARMLQERRNSAALYRNWDDAAFRKELAADPCGFLDAFRPPSKGRPLATLDEIHKFPRWKSYLKGLWDTRGRDTDFLVTGSGRLDVYQRGGDSLLGRYHQYRLHPLSLSEILGLRFDPDHDAPGVILKRLLAGPADPPSGACEAFESLLRFGGFPEPFLKQHERHHRLWLRERRERLTREDLRDLTRIQMLSSVEQMVELLPGRIGSPLSLNNLREDLSVSMDSVRLWMAQLERLYYCFRIRPYAGRLSRALRKEPKLYLYDWSELASEGARLENLVASALLRWCHFAQDWGQRNLELHYVRDKEKREVDFLLTLEGRPALLLEAKWGDPTPPSALRHFSEKLRVPAILICAQAPHPGVAAGIQVLPPAHLLCALP